jgi:DNA-binding protein HU-beta
MNKAQLIDAVADATDLSKASAGRAVESVLDIITSSLRRGDAVTLVGFGTFTTRNRAARAGRNPRTGATIQIPASTLPVFKPGKALKDAVN